jgi:hypothetical protein
MFFEIIGKIGETSTIASGRSIRQRRRLWKAYGKGEWRKKKGLATVKLSDGTIYKAELLWYEAQGIGTKEFKIKRIFD